MQDVNQILLGGQEIEVTDLEGKKRTIKVKKVSHLKGANLIAAYENDEALAKLVTDLTVEELENLTEDSFYDVVDTGLALNEKTMNRAMGSRAKKLQNQAYQEFLRQASTFTSSLGE